MATNSTEIGELIVNYGPVFSPIIAVLLAAWLSYKLYFRKKNFEQVKTEYVDEGIRSITESVNNAILLSAHNFHQALNLLKSIRDNDKSAIIFEAYRYFKYLDDYSLKPVEHNKINNLVGSDVFRSLHHDCHAKMTIYYHFLTHEFYVLCVNYLNNDLEFFESKDDFIQTAEYEIEKHYREIRKHTKTIECLLSLTDIFDAKNIRSSSLNSFKKHKNVKKIVLEAENFLTRIRPDIDQ